LENRSSVAGPGFLPELGQKLGRPVPAVSIYGIEIGEDIPFEEGLTDVIEKLPEENLQRLELESRKR
jgi:hypothetical protein